MDQLVIVPVHFVPAGVIYPAAMTVLIARNNYTIIPRFSYKFFSSCQNGNKEKKQSIRIFIEIIIEVLLEHLLIHGTTANNATNFSIDLKSYLKRNETLVVQVDCLEYCKIETEFR